MTSATIRYLNPGAMYPGPSAKRFGSTEYGVIGGGHKIAKFPDPVSGAAAQFDLLKNSYAGMPLANLLKKWSGGNSSGPYANYVASKLGIDPNMKITGQMLQDPNFAVKFAQAKSQWETGGKYPLDEAGWRKAHGMVYGGSAVPDGSFRPDGASSVPASSVPAGTPTPGSFRAAQEVDPKALGAALAGDQGQDPVIADLLQRWTYGAP